MKTEYQIYLEQVYIELQKTKEKNSKEMFKQKFLELLPTVKDYLKSSLDKAASRKMLKNQNFDVDDVIGELYLYVYDHIDEVREQNDFSVWLFEAMDRLVQDRLEDREFDEFFFKDIDEYSKKEWDAMEEEFSADGDGDLVMIEELDDPNLPKNDFDTKDVFVENAENELIERLEKDLSKVRMGDHIKMVLSKLPLKTQNIFDLHTRFRFSVDEIARIKRMHINTVDQALKETRDILKASIRSRFLK